MTDFDLIKTTISKMAKLSVSDLEGTDRHVTIIDARQQAMYFINEIGRYSDKEIGAMFNKHRTTVLNAVKKVNERIETNRLYKNKIQRIRIALNNSDDSEDCDIDGAMETRI